jgi:hypothetical protein
MTASTLPSAPSPVVRRSLSRVAYFDPSLPNDLVETLWSDPASLLSFGEDLRKKEARHTVRLNWPVQSLVLKHYVEPTRRHAAKQLVIPSRAWKTWAFTHRLVDLGMATPRPVACIENRWGPLRRDSFLMYPYVEGQTLGHHFTVEAKKSAAACDRLWQQINDLWQRLAELRVSLHDTHLGNFIVCPAGQLWLIDLDKGRFYSRSSVAARHQERAWAQLLRGVAACRSR